MDEKNNLIDRQTMGITQTKYSMQEILLLVFLGIAEFLALAEWVAAFIRNSHILGFWFGAVLFLLTATTLVLMILWVKKKVFEEKKKIIFGLCGLCLILLWFVICFLTVKILNYSQPNTNLPDLGFHDRFTQDWIEAAQKCSRITIQSRNEHTAVVKSSDLLPWKGDSFYVQTSHTDVFLGLITDGVYKFGPFVPPSNSNDPQPKVLCSGQTPLYDSCTYVECSKRIGGSVIDCNDFESK